MPRAWFEASGLEDERRDDEVKLSQAQYDHKWLGAYLDEVDDAIIRPEWFDAAVDAHKIPHLQKVFTPAGAKIAAHDPSDAGADAKGYSLRHGSVFLKILEKKAGEIDEGCDWATRMAIEDGADWFVWDGDGMGGGLKRQVSQAFFGKPIEWHMFRGSLAGKAQDNAGRIYMRVDDNKDKGPQTYAQTFKNNRAQYAIRMADRLYNTYRCVVRGEYVDPDEMVSFDSDGIENLDFVRSEFCRVPRVRNPNGLEQIMSKDDMKRLKIQSPNMFDSAMMGLLIPPVKKRAPIKYPELSIA